MPQPKNTTPPADTPDAATQLKDAEEKAAAATKELEAAQAELAERVAELEQQFEQQVKDAEEKTAATTDRIAELEQQLEDAAANATPVPADQPADPGPAGDYVVLSAGVSYAAAAGGAPLSHGLQGRVISLHQAEAERLLLLGAVRAADDQDRAREAVAREREAASRQADAGPADNPYGGSIRSGQTLEEHAAAEIAKAQAASQK